MIAIPNITKVLTKTRSRHQRVMQTGAGITLLSLSLASCGKVEVKELKPEQIAEYNKPGTVLIQANHKLEYSYAKPVFDAKTQSQLTQVVRQKVAQGEIKSEADAFAYAMRELLSHPLKYTLPGEKVEGQAEVPMVGTGFIVFGGVREQNYRFCNATCQQNGYALIAANQVPVEILEEQVRAVHQGTCPCCSGRGPVDVHTSHRVWSAFVLTSWVSRPHVCCQKCGRIEQIKDALFSLFLGWWGFP